MDSPSTIGVSELFPRGGQDLQPYATSARTSVQGDPTGAYDPPLTPAQKGQHAPTQSRVEIATTTAGTSRGGSPTPPATEMGDSKDTDQDVSVVAALAGTRRELQKCLETIRLALYRIQSAEALLAERGTAGSTVDEQTMMAPVAYGVPDLEELVSIGQSQLQYPIRQFIKGSEGYLPTIGDGAWKELEHIQSSSFGKLTQSLIDVYLGREELHGGSARSDEIYWRATYALGLMMGAVATIPKDVPEQWEPGFRALATRIQTKHTVCIESWKALIDTLAMARESGITEAAITQLRTPTGGLRFSRAQNPATRVGIKEQEAAVAADQLLYEIVNASHLFRH